jgi:hypothetical protein
MLGSKYSDDMERLDKTSKKINDHFDELIKISDEKDVALVNDAKEKTLKFVNTSKDIMKSLENLQRTPAELAVAYQQYKKDATPPAEASREVFDKVVKLKEEVAAKSIKDVDSAI